MKKIIITVLAFQKFLTSPTKLKLLMTLKIDDIIDLGTSGWIVCSCYKPKVF